MRTRNLFEIAFIVLLLTSTSLASARAETNNTSLVIAGTLLSPKASRYEAFGTSIAASDKYILVGDPADSTGAIAAGAAYLFNATTGHLVHLFHNPSPALGENFGSSVALSGNNILVGAQFQYVEGVNSGAAYLFDAVTGQLIHVLHKPIPASGDNFGASIAAKDNYVLVGATNDDARAINAGAAYLFNASTGQLIRAIYGPTPSPYDFFGTSVAFVGNNVLVGASNDHTAAMSGAPFYGAAYLFDMQTGVLLHTFLPSDSVVAFGLSATAVEDKVLIGAPDIGVGTQPSIAYLFNATSYRLIQTFRNPAPVSRDRFGQSVAFMGNNVLVGAPNGGENRSGAVYLFDATSGRLDHSIQNPTPFIVDDFGWSVASLGGSILVGDPADSSYGSQRGTVYQFTTGIPVKIDVRPETDSNTINARSNGIVRVAILTTPSFDASSVDPSTVRFGRTGRDAVPLRSTFQDIDRDGDLDLVLYFNIQDTGVGGGDTVAILTGMTHHRILVSGTDSISAFFP